MNCLRTPPLHTSKATLTRRQIKTGGRNPHPSPPHRAETGFALSVLLPARVTGVLDN